MSEKKKTMKILFVCLGNICRSPTAEGIMIKLVKEKNLQDRIFCDSAGTANYHEGALPDSRMREHAKARGYFLESRSRPVVIDDFEEFDLILAMDDDNYNNLIHLEGNKKNQHKIRKMVSFSKKIHAREVPDPYYGGADGFKRVIDILEDACENLLVEIEKNFLL